MMGLSPEIFGLSGESMEAYQVLTASDHALIDGQLCVEFHLYDESERAGTNTIAGTYYLTREGPLKLYQIDERTGIAEEIPLPETEIIIEEELSPPPTEGEGETEEEESAEGAEETESEEGEEGEETG